MVVTGKIASTWINQDGSVGLSVVSPEQAHWRLDQIAIPMSSAPYYIVGSEVLIDTDQHKILMQ